MRISDWSSDVCSSDLPPCRDHRDARREGLERPVHPDMTAQPAAIDPPSADWHERAERIAFDGRDRKSVAKGKGGSDRVDTGGRRHMKKKNTIIIMNTIT